MDLYPNLLSTGNLHSFDTRRITQSLHARIRALPVGSKQSDILLPFVQQIDTDIRLGKLQPHPYAFVHLLGIYKIWERFEEGRELWEWLVEQDERCVSQAAYGAAIELMAYGKMLSLSDLEILYHEGLKRFPGTFAEYHLSPDAIVPDRTQPTTISGMPMILLQGILTARVLGRDWKRTYLALDTALRLYPTQTLSRFFELIMTERPLCEAYTAFLLACRSGVCLRPTHLTVLFAKIRAAMKTSPSMPDRMMLVQAVANAIFAHLQAGGNLESIHVGNFILAFEQLLPEKSPGEDYEGSAAELRNTIASAAHSVLSDLFHAGMNPHIRPFEALISLSGKLRVPNLLTTTLQDIETAGLAFDEIGIRSVITAAGMLGRKDLIEEFWERIALAAEADRAQIPTEDWITLTKACRRTGNVEYFQAQLTKLSHTLTSDIERRILQRFEQPELPLSNPSSFDYMLPGDLESQIEKLKAQVKNIEAVLMSGQTLNPSTSPFYMHLDPATQPMGSIDQLRMIYDEMTTDPHQPPAPPPAEGSPIKPARSSAGIPLDELRFQNWITILELMDAAEEYESDRRFVLDTAMKTGQSMNASQEILRFRKIHRAPKRTTKELQLKIQTLRAASPTDVPAFRTIRSEVPDEKFKPMKYNAGSDKWNRVRIRKHPTEKQPNFDHFDKKPKVKDNSGASKLIYYVGLKSDHDASWKSSRSVLRPQNTDNKANVENPNANTSSMENKETSSKTSPEIPNAQHSSSSSSVP